MDMTSPVAIRLQPSRPEALKQLHYSEALFSNKLEKTIVLYNCIEEIGVRKDRLCWSQTG